MHRKPINTELSYYPVRQIPREEVPSVPLTHQENMSVPTSWISTAVPSTPLARFQSGWWDGKSDIGAQYLQDVFIPCDVEEVSHHRRVDEGRQFPDRKNLIDHFSHHRSMKDAFGSQADALASCDTATR